MFSDYHVHSIYSDDSQYLMEDIIKDAIAMKMEEICFTDHVDYGIKLDWEQLNPNIKNDGKVIANVNYPEYFKELSRLSKKYEQQIVIKAGMEFGIQMHTIKQFQKLYNKYLFDFIILSIHQVEDKEFWTNDFQKGRSEREYYQRYYQEMENVVRNYHDYSVLGHMDLIKRYDDKDGYDAFNNHKDIITRILKYVIKDGKGIELNTSSVRYGLDDLMPARDILKLYYDLGGRIITIGSDSHEASHLGTYIEIMKKELKKIGFKEFCTFELMKPIFHQL